MRLGALKPTTNNIISAYCDNKINRNTSVNRFAVMLNSLNSSCSVALNGEWGSGKTFFIKQVIAVMEAYNNNFGSLNVNQKARIKQTFLKSYDDDSVMRPHVCVYYDAWINDNDVDPLLSLIYAISKTCCVDFPKANIDFLNFATSLVTLFTGKDINIFRKNIEPQDILREIKLEKDFSESIKRYLSSLLTERGDGLVIFIDELDRCKPTYAVQLLERIKYYFDDERITFVFSTNISELQHTIKMYYGQEFNAIKYLDKFFDLMCMLPTVNSLLYWRIVLGQTSSDTIEHIIEKYEFSLRELHHYATIISIARKKYQPLNKITCLNISEIIIHEHLIPLILAMQIYSYNDFLDFLKGKKEDVFVDSILELAKNSKIQHMFLKLNSSFKLKDKEYNMLKRNIKIVYNDIFNNKVDLNPFKEVGRLSYYPHELSNAIFEATSLISDFVPDSF